MHLEDVAIGRNMLTWFDCSTEVICYLIATDASAVIDTYKMSFLAHLFLIIEISPIVSSQTLTTLLSGLGRSLVCFGDAF